MDHLVQHIESLIFTSQSPITVGEIRNCLKDSFDTKFKKGPIEKALASLKEKYQEEHFSFELVEIAGGFQFLTKTSYHNTIGTYLKQKTKKRLSKAALETLSIIAYKQPVVKSEMEKIRGVSCDYAVQKLLEKELVAIVGRGDGPGKPLQYGTSSKFMDYFGLKNIEDLPQPKDFREPDNEIGEKAPIDEDTAEKNHSTSDPAALRAKVAANLDKAAAEQKRKANEALVTDISVAIAITGIIIDGGNLAKAVLLPPAIEQNAIEQNEEKAIEEKAIEQKAIEENAIEENAIEENAIEENAIEENAIENIENSATDITPDSNIKTTPENKVITSEIDQNTISEETIHKFRPTTTPLNPSNNIDAAHRKEEPSEEELQENSTDPTPDIGKKKA